MSKHRRYSATDWRMSRLARDGIAEPVSRYQIILRRERGQKEKLEIIYRFFSPVQLTTSEQDY